MPEIVSADHLAQAEGLFEPQRQSDFAITINGLEGADNIQLALESSALATESNEEIELHYVNERRYVAGKAMYETVPMVIKDFVDVQVRDAIMKWRRSVYNPGPGDVTVGGIIIPQGGVGLAKNYKKRADIILYAPDGSLERVQTLIGCWPQQVTGGTLDMTASDKVTIELTLRFDRVEETFSPSP
jgi:hypothetical protein